MIIDDYSTLHDYPLIIDISMGRRRRRRRIGTYIQLPAGQASSPKFGGLYVHATRIGVLQFHLLVGKLLVSLG